MRIVCLSDTHGIHDQVKVPDGDILIHTGDFTNEGTLVEFSRFNDWLGTLPHKNKVFIAGNHDFLFERHTAEDIKYMVGPFNATYLKDREININGLRIYGTPWTPQFGQYAFMLERGGELQKQWAKIPHGLDILMTHGPARGILDKNKSGEFCGCRDLRDRIIETNPTLHVFGHIHESYGMMGLSETVHINASLARWEGPKEPIVFDL